ncbi:uncharacterized protein LOC129786610 [Lutzomyia longipalpis]|uniref:uncharacterized protein LOC129786610 n=1 Tax=Lutzomyia longipalpis TaxID=7200 RepID=UPI00248412CF|nr:uncharacterized protein LOC129786610 [Lutzomyia longipalpis]
MQSPEEFRNFEKELIRQVKAYPCLYDRRNPYFKDSQKKNQAWREVCSKFGEGISLTKCKKSFALLLNRFLKVHEDVLAEVITFAEAQRQFSHYNAMLYAKAFLQFSEDGYPGGSGGGSESSSQQSYGGGGYNQLNANKRPGQPGFSNQGPPNRNERNPSSFDYCSAPSGSGMGYSQQNTQSRNYPDRFAGGLSGWDQINPQRMSDFPQGPPSMHPQFNDFMNNRSQFMGQQQNQRNPDARSNGGNARNYDEIDRDNSHIDFFFRGVSQQVKRAKVTGEEFLDLQATILDILVHQLPNYNN